MEKFFFKNFSIPEIFALICKYFVGKGGVFLLPLSLLFLYDSRVKRRCSRFFFHLDNFSRSWINSEIKVPIVAMPKTFNSFVLADRNFKLRVHQPRRNNRWKMIISLLNPWLIADRWYGYNRRLCTLRGRLIVISPLQDRDFPWPLFPRRCNSRAISPTQLFEYINRVVEDIWASPLFDIPSFKLYRTKETEYLAIFFSFFFYEKVSWVKIR